MEAVITVLLVDDEPAMRIVVSRLLKRFGYSVLVAESGARAIQTASEHPGRIDLMITDVVMPGMSGPEAAAEVMAIRPGIPLLYMSGYRVPTLRAEGIVGASVPLLEKPFTSEVLRATIESVLNLQVPLPDPPGA